MTTTVDKDEIEQRSAPSADAIKAVRALAGKLWQLNRTRGRMEKDLAGNAAEAKLLSEKLLPDALRAIGRRSFDLGNHHTIELERFVAASIRESDRGEAIAWLADRGVEVKATVAVSFDKKDRRSFKKFLADLARRKIKLAFEVEETVNSRTLRAFVRKRIDGENLGKFPPDDRLPRDLFGVLDATTAVLTVPGEKK